VIASKCRGTSTRVSVHESSLRHPHFKSQSFEYRNCLFFFQQVNPLKMSIPSTTSKKSPVTPPPTSYKAFGCPTPYAEPLWYSRNVTPHYTDSHRKLRAAVRKYIDEEILPNAFEWESAGKVPDSARDCAPFSKNTC
jgi:hypothetical protein